MMDLFAEEGSKNPLKKLKKSKLISLIERMVVEKIAMQGDIDELRGQVAQLESEASDAGWVTNPDRMGR